MCVSVCAHTTYVHYCLYTAAAAGTLHKFVHRSPLDTNAARTHARHTRVDLIRPSTLDSKTRRRRRRRRRSPLVRHGHQTRTSAHSREQRRRRGMDGCHTQVCNATTTNICASVRAAPHTLSLSPVVDISNVTMFECARAVLRVRLRRC